MAKNELDKYITKSKKGDKDAYRKVIDSLYDEIYNLTAFIYDDDETKEKLTKHLFIKAYKNISTFDSNECDIHLWMAREATKELYKVVSERETDIFPEEIVQRDYDFDSIEDDDELGEASAEFNEGFLTDGGFDGEEECFAGMTSGEKIIYLLYCYEGYTIEEIEDIMNVDASYITSEVAQMRDGVLAAYAPIKAENANDDVDALEDAAGGAAAADKADLDFDDEAREFDEDIDIYNDEKSVRRKTSHAAGTQADDKKLYAIGDLRFTEKQFKALLVGVIAAVIIIVVIIVAVAASSRHSNTGTDGTNTTTKAATTSAASTAEPTAAAATEGQSEEDTQEATTARRVQSGTQPDVEFNTTVEATEPTAAAATTAATQATTAPTVTTAATVAPTTTIAATTTAAEQTTTATAASTAAAEQTTTTAAESTTTAAAETTTAATASETASSSEAAGGTN